MALSKEELKDIKKGVDLAKKKAMPFAYAKTRTDGSKDPLLLIDKTRSLVKKGIMVGGGKPHTLGTLLMADEGDLKGRLVFVCETGKAKDVEQGMKKGLKQGHALLNKAAFLMVKEFDAIEDAIAADAKGAKDEGGKADSKEAGKAAESQKKALKTRNAAENRLADLKKWTKDPKADVGKMESHVSDLKKMYKSLKKQFDNM